MAGELRNCPKCGKLFVYTVRNVCPNCYRKIEEDFQKVYEYIRSKEGRRSTIYEVSEATGVSVKQITEFVRQGRLSLVEYPNLAYPCERCGERLIRSGKLCDSCRAELQAEVKRTLVEAEQRMEKQRQSGRREKYYQLEHGFEDK